MKSHFDPECRRIIRYNKNAPAGAGNTLRRLTRSSDLTREGLAMDATQIPRRVIDRALTRYDVDSERGCWISTYSVGGHGYSQIGWRADSKNHTVLVHRVVWIATRGSIPDGMTVDHMCKQKRCCNPDHLRLLSNFENARRTSGRDWPIGQCVNGHPNSLLRQYGDKVCCSACYAERQERYRLASQHPCPGCGTAISRRSKQCHPCAMKRIWGAP